MMLFRKILTYLARLCLGFSLATCTYDRTIIYHKNYKVGNSASLHLTGYYFYTNEIVTANGKAQFFYPIFFYKDGSVIFMGAHKDTLQLKKIILDNPSKAWGYWGNYKISNDTIQIETISSYNRSFHHERKIRTGVVIDQSILFLSELDNKGNVTNADWSIKFANFNFKPDSTSNWIRKKWK